MRPLLHLALPLLGILAACGDKSDEPQPQPQSGLLENTLAGSYWREELHLLYQQGDDPSVRVDPQTLMEACSDDGPLFEEQVLLEALYIHPDNGRIYRYVADDSGAWTGYYEYNYRIEYDEYENSIRILASDDSLRYLGAVTESEMKVVAMEADRILFDAPVKPFVRLRWGLDEAAEREERRYLGLRVAWTRQPEDLFLWAAPLD